MKKAEKVRSSKIVGGFALAVLVLVGCTVETDQPCELAGSWELVATSDRGSCFGETEKSVSIAFQSFEIDLEGCTVTATREYNEGNEQIGFSGNIGVNLVYVGDGKVEGTGSITGYGWTRGAWSPYLSDCYQEFVIAGGRDETGNDR